MKFNKGDTLREAHTNTLYRYKVTEIILDKFYNGYELEREETDLHPFAKFIYSTEYVDSAFVLASAPMSGKCPHDWKEYTGFSHCFTYCTKCYIKLSNKENVL